ncbi:Wadjet anti-phage system protein JetD domain-containing protein [Ekhidna sp.]|jgi:hypothetical protein|uniref:Wadjet anti-phage system protein JetD domain-containing protein n=1 Tax=Ekhidna sp. TaxID=2608089 RepID=UPI0032F03F74
MITAEEIRKKAERKYFEILQSTLSGENCFPLIIRSNKALSKDFNRMSAEISEVFSASKDRKGFGYTVDSELTNTRQHGPQDIPKSIQFETLTDYLRFLNKEKEFRYLSESFNLIKDQIPVLKDWLVQNPKQIILNSNKWPDLLRVCKWFMTQFEPNKFYIRELPIDVHTKFIEENKPILKSLLDVLIPDRIDANESVFEKRFYLKYAQPIIRFRFLDSSLQNGLVYEDLSVPLDQFTRTMVNCKKVVIIENLLNFLTFPHLSSAIAVWGKGFAIEHFKQVQWLREKDIYYWSDLDVQGFQMLSQIRFYFPQTTSLLMDKTLLDSYENFIVDGTPSKVTDLRNLTDEEKVLYHYLSSNNLRLEQERIPQWHIVEKVNGI